MYIGFFLKALALKGKILRTCLKYQIMTQILMPKCLHMYKCIMSYKVQDIAN